MTTSIIIILCLLVLIAYLFDITAPTTKIPSIILLLLLGFGLKYFVSFLDVNIPDIKNILPLLGTVGLILIVLEGSLELDLEREKLPLIAKSALIALFPILILSFLFAYSFNYFFLISFKTALANAIPLSIISSAIAIPSAKNLSKTNKQFVTYESSLSDIFGVVFFNFIVLNSNINVNSFFVFSIEVIVMLLVSIISTIALSIFLAKFKHHIKFIPIIISIVLVYAISKVFHLPSLIFVLIFGITLSNLDQLKKYRIIERINPEVLEIEIHKFAIITTEFAFLVRALFFLLFGFLTEISDVINLETLPWAIGTVVAIFMVRFIFLLIFKLPISPLLYIAPRGLITILLFLSIPVEHQFNLVNNSYLIQTILICALIMMFGMMASKTKKANSSEFNTTPDLL